MKRVVAAHYSYCTSFVLIYPILISVPSPMLSFFQVAEIQNEGLGEHRLRDLNDEINKLLRERAHWERRIIDLGGPNYASKGAPKMTDLDGNIIDIPNPSGRGPGYRYFGAAKKLPGVRELFEKPPEVLIIYLISYPLSASLWKFLGGNEK